MRKVHVLTAGFWLGVFVGWFGLLAILAVLYKLGEI